MLKFNSEQVDQCNCPIMVWIDAVISSEFSIFFDIIMSGKGEGLYIINHYTILRICYIIHIFTIVSRLLSFRFLK